MEGAKCTDPCNIVQCMLQVQLRLNRARIFKALSNASRPSRAVRLKPIEGATGCARSRHRWIRTMRLSAIDTKDIVKHCTDIAE